MGGCFNPMSGSHGNKTRMKNVPSHEVVRRRSEEKAQRSQCYVFKTIRRMDKKYSS